MIELPADFLLVMKKRLGSDYDGFLRSYERPAERAVRVNTLKISTDDFEKISPLCLDGKVPWEGSGYYVSGEGLGKTVLHAAGAYYVQEPSAMCAVPELGISGEERVLDLCAAPGGKTTQIAAYMRGKGLLAANEINRDRCSVLKGNLERAGVKNALVFNKTPQELARIFPDFFDKILVDAPCSGEGMFKKEDNAIPEWSLENVRRCAERQAEILDCADKMLAGGGRLVYSTCTFSAEEDEEQIENFLKNHPDYTLSKMKKLYPHEVRGEGHFCAVLDKGGTLRGDLGVYEIKKPKKGEELLLKLYREWESATLLKPVEKVTSFGSDNFAYGLFTPVPKIDLRGVNAGILLGSACGSRFEPSHRLAMCLKSEEVRSIDVDEQTALNYLRGMTFECAESERGWRVVTYCGMPLGWCKAVGGVAKNHLPKGLRI